MARRVALGIVFTLTVAVTLAAQAKDTLTFEHAKLWRSFGGPPMLSADGQWLVYVNHGDRGDTLVAQHTTTERSVRIPVTAGANPALAEAASLVIYAVPPAPADSPRITRYRGIRLRDQAQVSLDWLDGATRFDMDPHGRWLAYGAVMGADSSGLYLRDLVTGQSRLVHAETGAPGDVVFDTSGTRLAFLWTRARRRAGTPGKVRYALHYARTTDTAAEQLVAEDAFGPDSTIAGSTRQAIAFTIRGSALRLAVGAATSFAPPAQPGVPPARRVQNPDSSTLEFWHYRDPVLASEKRRVGEPVYPALRYVLYDLDARRMFDIAVARSFEVQLSGDGTHALIVDARPKTVDMGWKRLSRDVELLDIRSGARQWLPRIIDGSLPAFSPGNEYVSWYDSGLWHAWHIDSRAHSSSDAWLPGMNFRMTNASTGGNRPWGDLAWTSGDARVVVPTERDLWSVDPLMRTAPIVITDSVGARQNLAFRMVDVSRRLAHATHLTTRAEGFYRVALDRRAAPVRLVMEDVRFDQLGTARLIQAQSAGTFVVSKETATRFGDLWVGTDLAKMRRVTNLNPQQARFRWVKPELVHWRSGEQELQGILYKPEDFDSTRQYPMVVTYYEIFSDSYHTYYPPAHFPRPLYGLNPAVYASHGYLVFVPDIVYTPGSPGASVLESVLPGVEAVVSRGFVKRNGIGCLGVSWGGYETFQLVTHTDIFAGCVVDEGGIDFTSMAGYLYAESWAMQRYFENGQGRLTGPIWEVPQQYIENSPIYRLNHVTTPMIIIANDGDEVVPWWQGLAAFMGLRRLGKEAYLLNYRGETHGLGRPANTRDRNRRVLEFFDAKLKGLPAPDWMTTPPR